MATQNYSNHVHRPAPTAAAFLFILIAIGGFGMHALSIGPGWSFGLGIAGLTAAVVVLILISRLYTTRLQNRIIKLEMRVRAMTLLTPEQQAVLHRLELPQIVALRFASDAELPGLLDRAVKESLKSDDIKRAVKNWVPDLDRT